MRILFAAKIIEDRLFQPPGLYAMSATLKEAGHETFIVDARSEDAVLAAVERVRPGLLGIATPTAHYPFFQRTAERIKKRRAEVFTVVGGVHATLVPEIVGDPGVDAVCRGEGDRVMPELVGRLERGETPHDQVGFWFSENGTIYENPVAPLIEELDSLPFADRSLTDPIPICREFPFGVFHASRGCPYGCTFCSNKSLSELYDQRGKYYRSHSPERFAAEVREAHGTYGYRMLLFMSEIFGLSIAWLERFVELYREGPALPFWCMARPAIFDEARARLLRDANCRVVEMGLEAGNEEYRQNVFKRHETNAQLIEAVKTAHRFGLYVQASNILGAPGSDVEKDLETVRLNLDAGVDVPEVCLYQPFPRTVLGDRVLRDCDEARRTISTTITPSGRRMPGYESKDGARIERLAMLFPLAAKSHRLFRALPRLIDLPLRTPYLVAYKLAMMGYKFRFMFGRDVLFSRRLVGVLREYFRN